MAKKNFTTESFNTFVNEIKTYIKNKIINKVDKNQGLENVGKVMTVGEDGNLEPSDSTNLTLVYHNDSKILEFVNTTSSITAPSITITDDGNGNVVIV